ncbi:MAG: hypothetical protein IPN10_08635 [Saprospiraceae bacterium]|nr:hypothetical protein [Saprospiraceae bacterium]
MKGKFKDYNAQSSQMVLLKSKMVPKRNTYTYLKLTSNGNPLCVAGPLSFGSAGINGEKCLTSVFEPTLLKWATFFSVRVWKSICLRTPGGNMMYSGDISVTDQNGIYKIHFKVGSGIFIDFQNNEQSGS